MRLLEKEPPKDTKYTVEISHEELIIIRDSVLKQGRYYCGIIGAGVKPSAPWDSIVKCIEGIIK